MKTDAQGNEEWNRFFAETEYHRATSVQQTTCGGFIIGGYARPIGGGFPEFLLLKTDHQGNKEWSQTFGEPDGRDFATSVQQTACGGFIIAGWTNSFGAGKSDFWLIKLAPEE